MFFEQSINIFGPVNTSHMTKAGVSITMSCKEMRVAGFKTMFLDLIFFNTKQKPYIHTDDFDSNFRKFYHMSKTQNKILQVL